MRLFKYVTPARIDVLRDRRIRFTPATALNDPFELRPYFDSFVPDDVLLQRAQSTPVDITPHLREAYEQLGDDAKSRFSLQEFLQIVQNLLDSPQGQALIAEGWGEALGFMKGMVPRMRESMWDLLTSKIGILSLSTDPANPLMWAHYADDFSGMVLEFNPASPFLSARRSDDDEFYHARQVVYRPREPGISLEALAERPDVLVSKLPVWSYEKEYRVLAPLDQAAKVLPTSEGPVHLFPVPPSAIVGVILGPRASPSLTATLGGIVAADPELAHVHIVKARLDDPTGAIIIPEVTP